MLIAMQVQSRQQSSVSNDLGISLTAKDRQRTEKIKPSSTAGEPYAAADSVVHVSMEFMQMLYVSLHYVNAYIVPRVC